MTVQKKKLKFALGSKVRHASGISPSMIVAAWSAKDGYRCSWMHMHYQDNGVPNFYKEEANFTEAELVEGY